MSGRATPSLGPIRGAGVASVYLRPGSFLSNMSNRMLKMSASFVLATLGGESKETGLAVAHSSSRPAQGVGGCLLPTPWPFGDTAQSIS
jgi:hypothetical protein